MTPKLSIWLTPERCIGCALCVNVCPKNLLYIENRTVNALGHHPIAIRYPQRCVACAQCVLVCKRGAIEVYK